jgi:UDP-glucose 4-epimerase
MAILVTGGAGYIGSHTCVELLNAGYEVIMIDNFSNSHPEVIRRIKEITGKELKVSPIDLKDKEVLNKVFENNRIDAVIHFAGLKSVHESVMFPLTYYENNIIGTIHLLQVMANHHVYKLVFSSSATVYGIPDEVPISEEAVLNAVHPYGQTKLMIEEILRNLYTANSKWSIALLRYFNPIGAHESGLIGEDPKGIPNNLLPYITQVAVGKLERLHVYGNDYPTKDGTGIRDYIHVVDLALGHIKALEKVLGSTGIDAYNLGTGKGYSVLEIVEAFEKVSNLTIPYHMTDRRPGDVAVCLADVRKAKEELNWQATRDIFRMCEDAWRWQKNNPDGYTSQIKFNITK